MTDILILTHVDYCPPGHLAAVLEAHQLDYTVLRCDLGELEGYDLDRPRAVAVMGGPMSVNDEAEFAWLAAEKRFIAEVVALGRPVLGICLGAQLIASAHGARVFRNTEKEIGWFDVHACTGTEDAFDFPPTTTVLHWHGETFELPPGARLLATSTACRHQAFQLGERTIGLQFHLEMTAESLRAIIDNCRAELVPARWIQDEAAILAHAEGQFAATHALMDRLLAWLTRR